MNPNRFLRTTTLCFSGAFAVAVALAPSNAGAQHFDLLHKRFVTSSDRASAAQGVVSPAASPNASNAQYELVTFSAPGSTFTAAGGISDAGLVGGFWYDSNNNIHGLIWRDHMLQILDDPGFPDTALGGANGAGIVIGNAGTASVQNAVLYDTRRAEWTQLPDFEGMPQNYGNGINNSGLATGEGCSSSGLECVGWTWDGERYSAFTAPGSNPAAGGTASNGVNDRGQVVGWYVDSNNSVHSYLKDGDRFTSFDVLPGGTFGSGINARGDIVGFAYDAQGNVHGFIGKIGHFATFDYPGALGTVLFGINARGDITGWWADTTGVVHAFVGYR